MGIKNIKSNHEKIVRKYRKDSLCILEKSTNYNDKVSVYKEGKWRKMSKTSRFERSAGSNATKGS